MHKQWRPWLPSKMKLMFLSSPFLFLYLSFFLIFLPLSSSKMLKKLKVNSLPPSISNVCNFILTSPPPPRNPSSFSYSFSFFPVFLPFFLFPPLLLTLLPFSLSLVFQTNLALRDRFLILQQEALLSSLSDSTSSSSSHHLSFLLIAFEFGEKCLNFHRIIYPRFFFFCCCWLFFLLLIQFSRGHPFLCLQQQTLLDILSQITSTSPLHKEKYEKLFKEVKEDKKSLFRK